MLNLKRRKIWIIIGTRPELIKQLPVYYECIKIIGKNNVFLVNSGQHMDFLNFYSKENNVKFDLTLKNLESTGSLVKNLKKSVKSFYSLIKKHQPHIILVQGDTTTAAACAYAASLAGVYVAHNEAGLRTFNNKNPYPEELNRKLISSVSNLHFAPTILNKENLINEGVKKKNIFVVGNTGIDSFFSFLQKKANKEAQEIINYAKESSKKIVFLTAHRREAKGKYFQIWFKALQIFFQKNNHFLLVCPKHPNKFAFNSIQKYLLKLENFYLTNPLNYLTTCKIIQNSSFVITDSGGIQEECASIGVPTIVCRNKTERQEALNIGIAKLTGFSASKIINVLAWAKEKKKKMKKKWILRPYGDGKASIKIAKILSKHCIN